MSLEWKQLLLHVSSAPLVPVSQKLLVSESKFHFAEHLEGLHQLLKGISMMKELTLRTRDYLVSFGECMSTRLFSAYLNKIGHKARQVCLLLYSSPFVCQNIF